MTGFCWAAGLESQGLIGALPHQQLAWGFPDPHTVVILPSREMRQLALPGRKPSEVILEKDFDFRCPGAESWDQQPWSVSVGRQSPGAWDRGLDKVHGLLEAARLSSAPSGLFYPMSLSLLDGPGNLMARDFRVQLSC